MILSYIFKNKIAVESHERILLAIYHKNRANLLIIYSEMVRRNVTLAPFLKTILVVND